MLEAVARGVRVFDLGRPLFFGMPQSPNHPRFTMAYQRRHGDTVRADGGSAANEVIVTGGHVGTHIDALSHVSHEGRLHGGHDAGGFRALGIDTVEPFVCRGVLLDVGMREPGEEVTPDDLERARGDTPVGRGDVVLIRTGWGARWDDGEAYVGAASGTPGVGEGGARWIAALGVRAAGSDTIAFERTEPGKGHALLPAHRVLLVEHGIHIVETLALEELAAAGAREFTFVLSPLKIVGGTGSPVRPLAVVSA